MTPPLHRSARLAIACALVLCLASCGLVTLPDLPFLTPTRTPDPVGAIAQRFPLDPDRSTAALAGADAFLTAGKRTVAAGRVMGEVPRPSFRYSDDAGATWLAGDLTAEAANATRVGESPTGLAAVKPGNKPVWLQLGTLDDGLVAWTSTDGAAWSRADAKGLRLKAVTFNSLAATSDGFVLVGAKLPPGTQPVATAWRSADGVTWVESPMNAPGTPRAVVAKGDRLVAVGDEDLEARDDKGRSCIAYSYASADGGTTWASTALPTPVGLGDFCSTALTVAATDKGFVAGGSGYHGDDDVYRPSFFTSPDGRTWTAAPAPSAGTKLTDLAASGGWVLGAVTVTTAGQTTDALVRFDGSGWVNVTSPVKGTMSLARVDAAPGGFLLSIIDRTGPTDTCAIWRSADGLAFTAATEPSATVADTPAVRTLVVGADKVRRAFGTTQNTVAMWQVDERGMGSLPATLVEGRQYSLYGAAVGAPGTVVWGSERVDGTAQVLVWFSATGASYKRTPDANLRIPGGFGYTQINDVEWVGDRWVAVGSESTNGSVRRSALVYTSTTGTDWRKGVAAKTYATGDSYSKTDKLTDLAGLEGRGRTMTAVTAVGNVLLAVGSTSESGAYKGAVWTSRDQLTWTLSSLPAPEGAVSWQATDVVATGKTVVATGWSLAQGSDQESYPLWTSTDGGATWAVTKTLDSATEWGFDLVALGGRVVAIQAHRDGSKVTAWVSTDGRAWTSGGVEIPDLRPGMKASVTSVTVEDDHLLLLVELTGATAKRAVVVTYSPPS